MILILVLVGAGVILGIAYEIFSSPDDDNVQHL